MELWLFHSCHDPLIYSWFLSPYHKHHNQVVADQKINFRHYAYAWLHSLQSANRLRLNKNHSHNLRQISSWTTWITRAHIRWHIYGRIRFFFEKFPFFLIFKMFWNVWSHQTFLLRRTAIRMSAPSMKTSFIYIYIMVIWMVLLYWEKSKCSTGNGNTSFCWLPGIDVLGASVGFSNGFAQPFTTTSLTAKPSPPI